MTKNNSKPNKIQKSLLNYLGPRTSISLSANDTPEKPDTCSSSSKENEAFREKLENAVDEVPKRLWVDRNRRKKRVLPFSCISEHNNDFTSEALGIDVKKVLKSSTSSIISEVTSKNELDKLDNGEESLNDKKIYLGSRRNPEAVISQQDSHSSSSHNFTNNKVVKAEAFPADDSLTFNYYKEDVPLSDSTGENDVSQRENELFSKLKDAQMNTVRCTQTLSASASFNWFEWCSSLPIYANSLYFQRYAQVMWEYHENSCLISTRKYSFPSWLFIENIKDALGNRPDSETYDVGSIFVPSKGVSDSKMNQRHLTPAMEQYWEIKSKHFDKVVFFKLGKFYEIFYVDAVIANQISSLNWMGGDEKPHVGFPETGLQFYAKQMLNSGFKVVVVEQMETPRDLEQRNKIVGATRSKAVKRDVCEIFSFGTITQDSMISSESRILFALYYINERIGFSFCDVSTSSVWVGSWSRDSIKNDDREFSVILTQVVKNLLFKITPVEVIIDQQTLPSDLVRIIKSLPSCPHINVIPTSKFSHWCKVGDLLDSIGCGFNNGIGQQAIVSKVIEKTEQVLENLRKLDSDDPLILSLLMLSKYLNDVFLKEKVFAFGKFDVFDVDFADDLKERKRLALDSTVLRHLNVFHSQSKDINKGTLYTFLNQAITPMGKRLLKQWLISPLYDIEKINYRLDVVEWFIKNIELLKSFRNSLCSLPDVERMLTRVCTRGLQGLRGAIYFQDIHSKYFGEFFNLLDSINNIIECITWLTRKDNSLLNSAYCDMPKLLNQNFSTVNKEFLDSINQLKQCFFFSKEANQWRLSKDQDREYDECVNCIEVAENELRNYLSGLIHSASREIGCDPSKIQAKFVHNKYSYEIEVPDESKFWKHICNTDVVASDITSKRAGFIRFRTTYILESIEKLTLMQIKLKDTLYGSQQRLFKKFYKRYYGKVLVLVSYIAEIDVLGSFALISYTGVGSSGYDQMCRPVFAENDPPILRIKNSWNPIVVSFLPPGSRFVPNDLRLNDCMEDYENGGIYSFLLVTGPNMGGKSTFLRQVCLTVILAHLGCYVPASECLLTPVDKIFTRLGAYDSILEGKSTLFVELEEIAGAVSQATKNSFIVIDELGRGTSTFDGTAIALAVAKYFSGRKIRVLFSTHFHLLTEELKNISSIRNMHMRAQWDEEEQSLRFSYKLQPGSCPKSHGILVAKWARIPDSITAAAATKAKKFETLYTQVHMIFKFNELLRSIVNLTRIDDRNTIKWKEGYLRYREIVLSKAFKSILRKDLVK